MKTKLGILIFLLAAALARAQTNNLTALLQQGLFEEQANRNLDAAIADYQALARQFDKDRQLAATAVFRLGECYRMQGKTNEAALEYRRILRDFSDQTPLATLSRQNLTGMGMTPAPAVSVALQTQKDLLAKQIALAEQDLTDTQRLAQTGVVPQDKTRAAEREVLRLKQQLAALDSGRAELLDLSSPVESEEDQEIARIQTMIQDSPDLINSTANGTTPLSQAARAGSFRVVTFLLDRGANINLKSGGETALHGATENGNKAMVELLLSRGADVNATGGTGGTALHVAAEKGYLAVAEVLLAHHADLNARNSPMNGECTPLHLAAAQGNVEIMKLLIARGADINAKGADGSTPLINAASRRQLDSIKALLAAKADPDNADNKGRTPLSYAAESGSPEIVKILLDAKADPNGGKLDAPLLCAIHKNDAASADLLLRAGAKPDSIGEFDFWRQTGSSGGFGGVFGGGPVGIGGRGGRRAGGFAGLSHRVTPLWLAISENQLPMVQLLLKFKADPNDSQTDRKPLLFSALSDTNILKALLDAGAKVDVHDRSETINNVVIDQPLLNAVVASKNTASVELLLKHSANPNSLDNNGSTPLHVAAAFQVDNRIFEFLFDHKADPNVRNNQGQTPLDILNQRLEPSNPNSDSVKAMDKELADLLRQHGALDKLPEWDRITVSRPSPKYSAVIFYKGTNDWNRFTLLDAILNCYQSSHSFGGGTITPAGMLLTMPFPDLARVTILRHTHGSTNETRILVNLLNSTNGVDCSKDVPLEFGDVVEIPERSHAWGDQPVGLSASEAKSITDYLKGSVLLVTHGQKVELSIYPSATGSELGSVVRQEGAQKVLLSSSDLSRVKVIRHDAKTGKMREWIVDCSSPQSSSNGSTVFSFQLTAGADSQPTSDLWLRDGDVIEVPEKP
jgi:cytohesin